MDEQTLKANERKRSDELSVQTFALLVEFSDLLAQVTDHFFARKNLSRSRYRILKFLWQAKHPVASVELANAIGVTPGNVTGLVDLLIRSDYIQKSGNESDRRKVKLEITEKGRTFVKQVIPEYNRIIKRFGRSISIQDKESVIRALGHIKTIMVELNSTKSSNK